MRPGPGVESPVRPRRKSATEEGSPQAASSGPTAFFLASESDVEKRVGDDGNDDKMSADTVEETSVDGKQADTASSSVYGVQSLADALDEAFAGQNGDTRPQTPVALDEGGDAESGDKSLVQGPPESSIPGHLRARSGTVASSAPLTPLQTLSPAGCWSGMVPSTPKSISIGSFRLSDGDSQAALEDEDGAGTSEEQSLFDSGPPELVMPSVALPDRRPFTNRGKNMGRLRVCVVGRKDTGKSSLIRAIVRQCEDIVQVDPITTTPTIPQTRLTSARSKRKEITSGGTQSIVEISASTKAYPSWWTEGMEESKILRRKSNGDIVLERNLCFIDTPGFSATPGSSTTLHNDAEFERIINYIENTLWHADTTTEMSDIERLNLVSGRGSSLIDVILFLFSEDQYVEQELAMFQRLSAFTNVIPLVNKADLISEEDRSTFKMKILEGLKKTTKPFLFGKSIEELLEALNPSNAEVTEQEPREPNHEEAVTTTPRSTSAIPPFLISSLPGSDSHEMDASLLMSSTYSPPLIPSELSFLLDDLFDPENMLWLRHSAARKFLSWRDRQLATALAEVSDSSDELGTAYTDPVRRERLRRLSAETGALVHRGSDATVRGSGWSARWAASNIYRDATILDGLPQLDRARWLLQRVNEEVTRGSIGVIASSSSNAQHPALPVRAYSENALGSSNALTQTGASRGNRKPAQYRFDGGELPAWARKGRKRHAKMREIDLADPLGLIKVWDGWGRVFAWSVGSGVVVGAVWVVVVRGWIGEWTNSGKWW